MLYGSSYQSVEICERKITFVLVSPIDKIHTNKTITISTQQSATAVAKKNYKGEYCAEC